MTSVSTKPGRWPEAWNVTLKIRSEPARLLKGFDGDYVKLWPRIGWKLDGVWTRYPGAFTWSLDAPEGHMPLINQLRGVRLMDSLLNHPDLMRHRDEAGLS